MMGSSRPFAVALHGGAGVIARGLGADEERRYLDALEEALAVGRDGLARGDPALDVVEAVVVVLEEQPLFNAGRGGVLDASGEVVLEASIMDGRNLEAGAVAELRTVRNPIQLARQVMERLEAVMVVGEPAERLAGEYGLEQRPNEWFVTDKRRRQWERARAREETTTTVDDTHDRGTVGCVALDREGDLAAATSTGGRTNKHPGRLGDTPVIGAGNYASNQSCAVSGTGTGEQFLRHTVARDVAALVEYRGASLAEAAAEVVHGRLRPGDGGLVAVDRRGRIAMPYNSLGMFRAAADAGGLYVVAIWEPEE